MKLSTVLWVAAAGAGAWWAWKRWGGAGAAAPTVFALPPGRSYAVTVRADAASNGADPTGAGQHVQAELAQLGTFSGFTVGSVTPDGTDPYVWHAVVTPVAGSANGGAIGDTATVKVLGVSPMA